MKKLDVTGLISDSAMTKDIWEEEDYHCPSCGKKGTIFSGGGDDYYVGEVHLCVACNAAFYLPFGVQEANDNELVYIKALIKKGGLVNEIT